MCAAKDSWLSNSFDLFSSQSKHSDTIVVSDDESFNNTWLKSRNKDKIDEFSSSASSSDYEDANDILDIDVRNNCSFPKKQHQELGVSTTQTLPTSRASAGSNEIKQKTNSSDSEENQTALLLEKNGVVENRTLSNISNVTQRKDSDSVDALVEERMTKKQIGQRKSTEGQTKKQSRTSGEHIIGQIESGNMNVNPSSLASKEKTKPLNQEAKQESSKQSNLKHSADLKVVNKDDESRNPEKQQLSASVASSTVVGDSLSEQVNKMSLTTKVPSIGREQLVKALEQKKHLIRVSNVAALPDGGKKLFDKVAEIERDIAAWDSLPAETLAQLQKEKAAGGQRTVVDKPVNAVSTTSTASSRPASSVMVTLASAGGRPEMQGAVKIIPGPESQKANKVMPVSTANTTHSASMKPNPIAPSARPLAVQMQRSVNPQPSGIRTGNPMSAALGVIPKQNIVRYMSSSNAAQGVPGHIREIEPQWMSAGATADRMYMAQPQQYALYQGKMTAQQKRDVIDVTTAAIEQLHQQLASCPGPEVGEADPEGLTVSLLVHQQQALAWLRWREQQVPAGGILADDMGLGKTLTTISLILKSKQSADNDKKGAASGQDDDQWLSKFGGQLLRSEATLVVCPASVLHQWKAEIEKRCKKHLLSVLMYHGPDRTRDVAQVARADVVLTTYDIIRSEIGPDDSGARLKEEAEKPAEDLDVSTAGGRAQALLLRIVWRRVVLDEAHTIKNHKSLTAVAVCRLRADCRWALSGTPIQNNLLDMYSLLRFLRCSPFDEYKVWKRQVDNKSDKGSKRLNILINCLLLRRTKTQLNSAGKPLVSLPNKSMELVRLALSPEERRVYTDVFTQSRAALMNYLLKTESASDATAIGSAQLTSESGSVGERHGVTSEQGKAVRIAAGANTGSQVLLYLLRLRQCCSHLSLLNAAIVSEDVADDGLELDLVSQLEELSLGSSSSSGPATSASTSNKFDALSRSTKLQAIIDKLQEIKRSSKDQPKQKSVIVSQWTAMLEITERHLVKCGFRCCTIKGSIAAKHRTEIVESFNTDENGAEVLLLSLRAGGVGLNLIGGNHLFILDLHWNPALEQQACDRIYRVGQSRDVFIYKFICTDTIEEKIIQLQERKLSLASSILAGGSISANKLTLADLKLIFGLDQKPPAPSSAWSLH